MSERAKFTPIRGLEDTLLDIPFINGQIYFATDTGKMFLDCFDINGLEKNKMPIGGGGVSLVYGQDLSPIPASDEEDNAYFALQLAALESKVSINDLILNSDGCFYKVLSTDELIANCLRLAVSGSGGGGGQVIVEPDVRINFGNYSYDFMSFIYGQQTYIQFTPEAEHDQYISLRFQIFNEENETIFEKLFTQVRANRLYQFDMSQVPMGTNLKMIITLISPGSNSHPTGLTRQISGLNVVKLGVRKDDAFVTTTVQTGPVQVNYYIDGGTGFNLKVYPSIDGVAAKSLEAEVSPGTTTRSVRVPVQSHGVHTIGIKVGTLTASGLVYSDEITYEIAWVDPNDTTPLIWIKDYPSTVVQYENCVINYMVYDPVKALTGSKTEVNLLDTLINEEISTVYPQYSNSSTSWLTWDLTENYHVGNNIFTIQCGTASKDIIFSVTTEGSRDLGLVDSGVLRLNLSSTGRSNEESLAKRTTWSYTDVDNREYTTTFTNFNWYNNGWKDDNDGRGSYLSVANGSSVNINFTTIPFNTSNLSYTIELRFRVRNVQEYSTLVKTEPYYYILDEQGNQMENSVSINVIKEQNLKVATDKDGNWLMDEAHSIKKTEFEKGVCFKFWDPDTKQGLFVGTQEAYFKTPDNTVSVRYKEDDIINLTITAGYQDLLSIYLNGILSGAVSIGENGFTPNTTKFEINSKYCDVDIYKLRVYENNGKPLTMPQVIHNYLSDEHNLTLYDQNQLTKDEDPTALSYKKIIAYNNDRLAELNEEILQGHSLTEYNYNVLTMPYATIEIIDNNTSMKDPTKTQRRTDDDRLPYVKGGKRYCEINFVNPVGDALLEAGKITEEQYYSHAPSYRVVGCEIDVQGTSSQGYPRRNFKTKMKSATGGTDAEKKAHEDWGWFYTKGSKAGKKFKKWNMDNAYYATNKFTWKIDYMESSGTYNTGFANLMGNMYDSHPLDDYDFDGVSPTGLRTSVYGFPLLVFQKHSTPADKTKIGTTYEDEIYEFIGRYNLNLDKSSNELYGFEADGEQKYIDAPWDEEVEKEDGTKETIHHLHPTIAEIAECWELRDNQGTWCSFSFPADAEKYKDDPNRNDYYFGTYEKSSYDGNGDPISEPKLEVINHFEYRYSPVGDELDACYKYDTSKFPQTLGTFGQINQFLRAKYANLEKLMIWLDSTSRDKVTNQVLAEPYGPIVTSTPGRYIKTSDEELVTGKKYYILDGTNYVEVKSEELNERYLDDYYEITKVIPGEVTYTEDNGLYYVTYYKDTAEYRLEKFRNEFTKHLNLDYCAIYYVLTELLLCYDSRGKNMMIASWGPQEVGGEYIWYPIFYDIDTQLGLNNIGATLWDYDTDASLEGTFSTATSVLWINFADAFQTKIISTYKDLRSSKLTETNIEGAYLCDPEVFDSYAMRGVRPIVAIGLDEYVKYLKPSVDGYLNTDGNVEPDSYGYVYAINGDRKLSRELLIRNRLNYLDSYWRAGSYSTEVVAGSGGCVLIRANANAQQTSDLFLDSGMLNEIPSNANAGTTLAPYNTGATVGLDAIPEYTITPFLSQYVFTFIDTNPSGKSVKFQGTPIEAAVSDSIADGYKIKPNLTQQITRIPGPRFLSSLGDLSTKYFDQFEIPTARRLLDLNLGSDIEGYFNNRSMANFIINGSMYDAGGKLNENRKTLLQKVVLTNMGALTEAIDLSGSEKLQEFRALGTQIQGIKFADGAPLTTVHLPKTINGISLIEAKNLTNLINSRPVIRKSIAEGSEFYPHSTYEGLYLEGLTDIDDSAVTLNKTNNRFVWNNVSSIYHNIKTGSQTDDDVKSNIINLRIKGGNLKYESYKLLLKAIAAKENAAASGIRLKIDYENINWCPYRQLSVYDDYDSVNSDKYFQATDHSTFVPYTFNSEDWYQLLKNGKIYYYEQSDDEGIITSLDVLDFFIQDYEEGLASATQLNHYTDMDSTSAHWPRLTGIIYVNNSAMNPIQEDKLTSVYAEKWPDLTIFAANIRESNLVKFVQMSSDNRENELEIIRLPTTNDHPVLPTVLPSKGTHYDFIGWSTDIAGENMFIYYDFVNREYYGLDSDNQRITATAALNNYSFNENGTTLVLYAQFIVHKQVVEFIYPDDSVVTMEIEYNTKIQVPDIIPYKDDSALPLEQTYQFLGWNYLINEDTANTVVDENTFKITQDFTRSNNNAMQTVWATYSYGDDVSPELFGELKPISVYDNIHPEYFKIIGIPNSTATTIQLEKQITGKIVIPHNVTYNGTTYPVTTFSSNGASNKPDPLLKDITHVFFEKDNNGKVSITNIGDYCFFECTNLQYFEFSASGLTQIGTSCFQGVHNLKLSSQITGTISTLNVRSFINAFANLDNPFILVDGNVTAINNTTFRNSANKDLSNITLQFGSNDKPCTISMITSYNNNTPLSNSIYYTENSEYHLVVNKIIIYVVDINSFWTSYENESYQFDNDKRKALLSSLVSSTQANNIITVLSANNIALEDFLEVRQAGS